MSKQQQEQALISEIKALGQDHIDLIRVASKAYEAGKRDEWKAALAAAKIAGAVLKHKIDELEQIDFKQVRTDDQARVMAFALYVDRVSGGTKFAWRFMLRDLQSGRSLPGVGTWRSLWAEEHPGEKIPASYPCGWIPKGWQYSNLMRALKRAV